MNRPTLIEEDVPSPIDFRKAEDAEAWILQADVTRPQRAVTRQGIADEVESLPGFVRVLELGVGPGALAHQILHRCSRVSNYTALDFSEAMLKASRSALSKFSNVDFVLADFKTQNWGQLVSPPFDVVVTMQAVHELRHKQHALRLYQQIKAVMKPGGKLVACDHTPKDDSVRATSLYMTEEEQVNTITQAGFSNVRSKPVDDHMVMVVATN